MGARGQTPSGVPGAPRASGSQAGPGRVGQQSPGPKTAQAGRPGAIRGGRPAPRPARVLPWRRRRRPHGLECGDGTTGRSGPAAPVDRRSRCRCRFASGQDGGPEPRLPPEAGVKGQGAGRRTRGAVGTRPRLGLGSIHPGSLSRSSLSLSLSPGIRCTQLGWARPPWVQGAL